MSDKKILYVLLIVLLMPIVFGAKSFTFYSGAGVDEVCPRSTGLFNDVVKNTGDEPVELTVSSSGTASVFSTTVPSGFVLFPGQIKNIYTYITPMSNVDVGTYSLKLNANGNGLNNEITHNFNVKDCYAYEFKAIDSVKNVCPCGEEKYSFEIRNNGEYTESYTLNVEGSYKDKVVLSQNTLTLNKGDSKIIYAYVKAGCNDEGDFEFTIKVEPNSGKLIAASTVKLTVDACYNFDISTEKDLVNMCEHSQETLKIDVKNDGTSANTYNLDVEGPAWANLENNKLEIGAGQTKSVNLDLVPDYGVEGNFEIKFNAIPVKGELKAQNTFNVNVKKCYDVSVELEKDIDKICNALENEYNVLIRNKGEQSKDFFVSVDGPNWAKLDQSSVNLGAGEEISLKLTVNPPYDNTETSSKISIKVVAKDSDKISSEDSIEIQTVSQKECYNALLGIKDKSLKIYYDSSATVPIVVENKGADIASYSLGVSGTAASFVYLNPSVVEIQPGESEVVYLYVAPSSKVQNGDYSAVVSVRLEDSTILSSETINIQVTDSPEDVQEGEEVVQESGEKKQSFFSKITGFFTKLFAPKEKPVEPSEEVVIDNVTVENVTENITEEIVEEVEENVTENVTEEVIEPTGEVKGTLLAVGENIKFKLNDEEHTLQVKAQNSKRVVLEISSDPVLVKLDIGDVKNVDIDGDGIDDLEVTFNGFVGDKADISYKAIDGKSLEEITGNAVEEEQSKGNFFSGFLNGLKTVFNGLVAGIIQYKWQLIIIVAVVIIIWILAKTSLWKKITRFFEEEEIKEEKIIPEQKVLPENKEVKSEPKKEAKHEDKKEEVDEIIIEEDVIDFKEEKHKKTETHKHHEPVHAVKQEKPKRTTHKTEHKTEEHPAKKEEKHKPSKKEEKDEVVIEFDDDE